MANAQVITSRPQDDQYNHDALRAAHQMYGTAAVQAVLQNYEVGDRVSDEPTQAILSLLNFDIRAIHNTER